MSDQIENRVIEAKSRGDRTEAIIASAPAPLNGRLTATATFSLRVGGQLRGPVSLTAAATANNASVEDLVVDLNEALSAAGLGTEVIAEQIQGRLTLRLVGAVAGQSLEMLLSAADPAATVLHFANGQREGTLAVSYPLGNLRASEKSPASPCTALPTWTGWRSRWRLRE